MATSLGATPGGNTPVETTSKGNTVENEVLSNPWSPGSWELEFIPLPLQDSWTLKSRGIGDPEDGTQGGPGVGAGSWGAGELPAWSLACCNWLIPCGVCTQKL